MPLQQDHLHVVDISVVDHLYFKGVVVFHYRKWNETKIRIKLLKKYHTDFDQASQNLSNNYRSYYYNLFHSHNSLIYNKTLTWCCLMYHQSSETSLSLSRVCAPSVPVLPSSIAILFYSVLFTCNYNNCLLLRRNE